ncbi:MAG TPA: DNA adenine methylase, partial [Ruminococcaceae bacterium]|nr:DNA adenine methylase [Oscillospiraceae bacterium]
PADFVYCDPPYLITTGSYNDGNRGFQNWKEAEELALYEFLDRLDRAGVRFALSNVLEHKGKVNKPLIAWSRKYDVIPLASDYSNANYHTRKGESREVLIVNYRSAGR